MADLKADKPKRTGQITPLIFRYYLILTALLAAVILTSGYFFVLKPKLEQLGPGGNYDLAALQQAVAKRDAYLKDLNKLLDNYRMINQADLEKFERILPAESDLPGLFAQLQDLTQNDKLLLSSVSIMEMAENAEGDQPAAGKISRLSLNLNLSGPKGSGYNEIKKFISDLENNLRLFDVNAVYFTPGAADFSVNLFAYYIKP